jgi:hypothetical protein
MSAPDLKTPDALVGEFVEIASMLNGAAVLLHGSDAVHGDDNAAHGLCLLNRAIRELDAAREATEHAFGRMQEVQP